MMTYFNGAEISEDGLYRYLLWRTQESLPTAKPCVFIMLNPSTADATIDDPTIKRCIEFARRESCGRLLVVNLFAYRSTDPRKLKDFTNRIGGDNDYYINNMIWKAKDEGGIVIAAWGSHGAEYPARVERVLDMAKWAEMPLQCFGLTLTGQPKHPLYLRADTPLVPYGT